MSVYYAIKHISTMRKIKMKQALPTPNLVLDYKSINATTLTIIYIYIIYIIHNYKYIIYIIYIYKIVEQNTGMQSIIHIQISFNVLKVS